MNYRPPSGARCHLETVGASLEVLRQRANDEMRDANDVQRESTPAYADIGSVEKGKSRNPSHSWESFMDMLDWQWQWMGKTPTMVAAAGWADQIRVCCLLFLYLLYLFAQEVSTCADVIRRQIKRYHCFGK